MKDITKYQGVIPAFYACYDAEGNISTEGVKALTRHLIAKGVKGVYVGGSSGECIYQHVDERKAVLEAVVSIGTICRRRLPTPSSSSTTSPSWPAPA